MCDFGICPDVGIIVLFMTSIYKPEIAELIEAVEKKYTKTLNTSTDFEEFSLRLKKETRSEISPSTLKRLWGYVNDRHTPRMNTLDILSVYVGFENFKGFCDWLKQSVRYNSSFFGTKQIVSDELTTGQELEIGWAPNRYLRLSYMGDGMFEVVEARESKLLRGDKFIASSFFMGHPLFLPYVIRDNKKTNPFIAGRNGGLTILNTVSNG